MLFFLCLWGLKPATPKATLHVLDVVLRNTIDIRHDRVSEPCCHTAGPIDNQTRARGTRGMREFSPVDTSGSSHPYYSGSRSHQSGRHFQHRNTSPVREQHREQRPVSEHAFSSPIRHYPLHLPHPHPASPYQRPQFRGGSCHGNPLGLFRALQPQMLR